MIRTFAPSAGGFARYGKLQGFAVEGADGREVGRLAAIVNPRLRGRTGAPLGQIGYFSCADDEASARALFERALAWLATEGAQEVVAPMNGGAHLAHRLLVAGFERDPFLNEPRNPPHYPRLFEAAGFRPFRRWESYDIDRPQIAEVAERLVAGAERMRAAERFRLEHGAPRDVTLTLKRIHALLDGVWAGHTGYAALDFEELIEGFAGLLGIMTERHLTFLVDRATGRDVGLAFGFPHYARPERPPRRFVAHTVAVLPETRRTGGSHLIAAQHFKDIHDEGYPQAVIALVDEDLHWFGKIVKATRTYALYARPVSLTTPA